MDSFIALMILFINYGLLFWTIDASFLGTCYVIIYVGAFGVLFLFIQVILNFRFHWIRKLSRRRRIFYIVLLSVLTSFAIFFTYLISGGLNTLMYENPRYDIIQATDLQLFASHLFISHEHYMFLSLIILLLALYLVVFLVSRQLKLTHTIKTYL